VKPIYKILLCLLAWTAAVRPQSDNVVIKSVTMTGNKHVSMNEVLYIIRQRPPNWFFRRPDFNSRLL